LRVDQTPGITSAKYQRLSDLAPRFAAQCHELAQCAIPESLHHGDLHDGNIFVRDGRYIFFDWGDASVTHPFFSFRTVMVSNENSLGLSGDAPEHDSLRDIYLEAWARSDSRANLLSAFNLARQLWMIPTALVWHRILSNSNAAAKAQYAEPVPALLQEFLNAQAST
jgi:aminoglycoside phosphotransferase (APT) family kinase protein